MKKITVPVSVLPVMGVGVSAPAAERESPANEIAFKMKDTLKRLDIQISQKRRNPIVNKQ